MDNLTHTLTGLMMARAGLNRFTPRAGLVLMLAANMPDIDIVSWAQGRAAYLDLHRGYTHAWALVPLMALLPVLAAGLWRAPTGWSWWKAWLVSMVGVASHLLLDWTNNYGIRFGMPFEGSWHRLDLLYVIDPWVWMLLLFGVAGPFLSRLVSLEMGAKRSSGAGAACFVLVAIVLYAGGRSMVHEQAIAVLNSRVYEGQNPRRVGAFPMFGNPLKWRVVVELNGGFWVSQVNLLEDFDPAEGRVFFQAAPSAAIEEARLTEDFQSFLRFSQFPLWRTVPLTEGSFRVELFDLRFGDPVMPGFVATAIIEKGHLVQQSLQFGAPRL